MHSLTIYFGPSNVMWQLLYRTEEAARKMWVAFKDPTAEDTSTILIDDFGQELTVRLSSVHGAVLEDLEVSRLAHIERALHQARMQANVQQRAEADATLRTAASMRGPAAFMPQGLNGGRQ